MSPPPPPQEFQQRQTDLCEFKASLVYRKSFTERCSQCAAVSWGLTDEGKYYCTSCHNVTD
ncbi:hypothetical protein STEG23_031129, partial [Scotinomys teguina]